MQDAADQMQSEWDEELPSILLARELLEQWPTAYGDMQSRTQSLKNRVIALRTSLDDAGDNPLRNLAPYQQRPATELDGLGREIFELRGQVDRFSNR